MFRLHRYDNFGGGGGGFDRAEGRSYGGGFGGYRGGGGGGFRGGGPRDFKPGDWNCSACNEHNFASREVRALATEQALRCRAAVGSTSQFASSWLVHLLALKE